MTKTKTDKARDEARKASPEYQAAMTLYNFAVVRSCEDDTRAAGHFDALAHVLMVCFPDMPEDWARKNVPLAKGETT